MRDSTRKLDLKRQKDMPFCMIYAYTRNGIMLLTGDIHTIHKYWLTQALEPCHAWAITYAKRRGRLAMPIILGNEALRLKHLDVSRYKKLATANDSYFKYLYDKYKYLPPRTTLVLEYVPERPNPLKKDFCSHILFSWRRLPKTFIDPAKLLKNWLEGQDTLPTLKPACRFLELGK